VTTSTTRSPSISAARRAVIKSLGTVGDPRHDRAGGRPDWYVYASPALGVIARFCRDEACRSFMTLRIWRADVVVLFDWLMSVDLNAVPVEHP
jgi:hypothetical protein